MQRARWTCNKNRNKNNVFAASQLLKKYFFGWIKQILELKGLGDLVCSLMLAFLISSCHCSSVQYLFSISLKVSSSWPETALIFNFSLMISSSSSSILRGKVTLILMLVDKINDYGVLSNARIWIVRDEDESQANELSSWRRSMVESNLRWSLVMFISAYSERESDSFSLMFSCLIWSWASRVQNESCWQ